MSNINLYQALLKVQSECFKVKKTEENPYFKSKYADYVSVQLAIFPLLHANGLLISQPTVVVEGKNYVRTILVHAESGESIQCDTEIILKNAYDAQAQGSGITYARRYGLMALLGLGATDDDGNRASGKYCTAPISTMVAAINAMTDLSVIKSLYTQIKPYYSDAEQKVLKDAVLNHPLAKIALQPAEKND